MTDVLEATVTVNAGQTANALLRISSDLRFCHIADLFNFATASSFIDSSVAGHRLAFREILDRVRQVTPNERMIIVGHTDEVGSSSSNGQLSQRRADSVLAVLQLNVNAWETIFQAERSNAWGNSDFRIMLQEVNGTPPIQADIDAHRANNAAGAQLRSTLFTNYFDALLGHPASSPVVNLLTPPTLACGEQHILGSGNHAPSRRSEVFFFRDNNTPVISCADYHNWQQLCQTLPPVTPAVTIANIDRIIQGQIERVQVTIIPSPLPMATTVTLELTTHVGTGAAEFVSTNSNTMVITSSQTVRIRAVTVSNQVDNIQITAKETGATAILAQEDFTVVSITSGPQITLSAPVVVVKKVHTNPARQTVILRPDPLTAPLVGSGIFTRSSDRVRFFTAANGGTEITFNGTDNLFIDAQLNAGVTLFTEGNRASAALNDEQLELTFLNATGGQIGNPAIAILTAVELTLDIAVSRTNPGVDPLPMSAGDKINPGRLIPLARGDHSHERAMLTVRQAQPADFNGELELTAIGTGTALFSTEQPASDQKELASPQIIQNISISANSSRFFVEGQQVSSAARDAGYQLGIRNVEADADRVNITTVSVTIPEITSVPAGQTIDVPISVAPALLNGEMSITLTLSTTSGTGEAKFSSTNAGTRTIIKSETITIQGITAGSVTDNIRLTAVITGQAAILAEETFSVRQTAQFFLQFEIWNLSTQTFEPLPAGINVDLMDYDPVSGNDVLVTESTDANGKVSFSILGLQNIDESEPDIFFRVRTNGLVHAGHTLPDEWSTKGWNATDGTPGYHEDFTGDQLGSAAVPLVFRIGLDVHARLVYPVSGGAHAGNPAPAPSGVGISFNITGIFSDTRVKTFRTNSNGEIHGVIFNIEGGDSVYLQVEFDIADASINLNRATVDIDAWKIPFDDNDQTSLGLHATPRSLQANTDNRNVALYFLKVLRELSTFLFHITGGVWLGFEELEFYLTSLSGVAYSWPVGEVNLPPADHWDRGTIIHEITHQIMWQELNFSSADIAFEGLFGDLSLKHSIFLLSNPEHALIEGWPEFMEAIFERTGVPPYNVANVRDDDGNNHPLGPPPINKGESVEGAFANGLLSLFLNDVVTPAVMANAIIPESVNGDVSLSSAWITNTNVRDRFLSMIWRPFQDLRQSSSDPTTSMMIARIEARNPSNWHVLRPRLQAFNMAMAGLTVISVTPDSGSTAGGQSVTLVGTNFTAGVQVQIGGNLAAATVNNSTSITAVTPPGSASIVDITVSSAAVGSNTLSSAYTYTAQTAPAPTVTAVQPGIGATSGGTFITITGTGFSNGATVSVGGNAATNVNFISSTELRAIAPARTAGRVDIQVQNPDAQSGTLPAGFEFIATSGAGPSVQFSIRNRIIDQNISGAAVRIVSGGTSLVQGTTNNSGRVTLNLSSLPDGTYQLQIEPVNHTADPVGPAIGTATGGPNPIWRRLETDISVRNNQIISTASFHITFRGNQITALIQPVWIRSPHQGNRAAGTTITSIIVHHTGGTQAANAINWFLNPSNSVSAHYVIDIDGRVVKMVHESRRSNHAGRAYWDGQTSMNSSSVGIEIVNRSGPYTTEQYTSLLELIRRIRVAHPTIPANAIIGHSDIALNTNPQRLGRKAGDPGDEFDWSRLENAGLGLIVRAGPHPPTIYGNFFTEVPNGRLRNGDNDANNRYGGASRSSITSAVIQELQTDLSDIGYFCPVDGSFGQQTLWAVNMFQDHFFSGARQRTDTNFQRGEVDLRTAEMIKSVR
ncbi:MAG: N-acetylmuramoyl-L-alanine amidase [Ardenticatenaceae bacterium]|nr:N-acetylmuramoyl-L-alanine amidase [Anaerolineales bacterium]MCB9005888.1 N-acetylmuramoyl-L-alanine amidase [Ardenticatenaceae bacterium]